MQVKLNVPKTKAKFWPPLQDIHCHGSHLGRALGWKNTKKNVLRFFGEGSMEKTKINIGKTKKNKKKKKQYVETLWGGPHGENQKKLWKNKKKSLEKNKKNNGISNGILTAFEMVY